MPGHAFQWICSVDRLFARTLRQIFKRQDAETGTCIASQDFYQLPKPIGNLMEKMPPLSRGFTFLGVVYGFAFVGEGLRSSVVPEPQGRVHADSKDHIN